MTAGLSECDRCRRPARRARRLYARARGAQAAILAGRFGRQCFYAVAAELAAAGAQPEYENARIIYLRGHK